MKNSQIQGRSVQEQEGLIRAVSYSRVSSTQQIKQEGLTVRGSLEEQARSAREVAEKNGWSYVRDYCEAGISGEKEPGIVSNDNLPVRPALQELLDAAFRKEFDVVIFRHADRLARLQHLYLTLTYQLEVIAGVQLYNLSKPAPVVEPAKFNPVRDNKLVFERAFEALQGQLEQNDRVRKLAAGRKRQVEAGRFIARPPYGYKSDYRLKDEKYVERIPVPDPEEFPTLQMIFQMALEGHTARQIVRELSELGIRARNGSGWSSGTIDGILNNPFYAGILRYSRRKKLANGKLQVNKNQSEVIYTEHNYERAITKEQFEFISAQRATRLITSAPRSVSSSNPLSGILKCGFCGGPMTLHRKSHGIDRKEYIYFICGQHSRKYNCQYNRTPAFELLDAIWLELDSLALEIAGDKSKQPTEYFLNVKTERQSNQVQVLQAKILEIRQDLEKQEQRASNLLEDLADRTITKEQYQAFMRRSEEQKEKLAKQLKELEDKINLAKSSLNNLEQTRNLLMDWKQFSADLRSVPFDEWNIKKLMQVKNLIRNVWGELHVKSRYDTSIKKWLIEVPETAQPVGAL